MLLPNTNTNNLCPKVFISILGGRHSFRFNDRPQYQLTFLVLWIDRALERRPRDDGGDDDVGAAIKVDQRL